MARATARKRVTKQKTKKQKGIRVSKRPATAEEAANAAKCPSPKTHEEVFYDEDDEWPIPPDELLRQQIVGWQKQLAESDVALPTAETIKTAASLYWQTRYAQEKPDTPLHYHTAAGQACNDSIRLIMSWMRKACPENLSIDSAFQDVVCAVRNGDFTGTQQLAALLKKQAESPAAGRPKQSPRKKRTRRPGEALIKRNQKIIQLVEYGAKQAAVAARCERSPAAISTIMKHRDRWMSYKVK